MEKRVETTALTILITKGWKKNKDGHLYRDHFREDIKPAFIKEIDQSLFSNKVKDLPYCFWQMPETCPNDLIKWLLAIQIRNLVEVIDENQALESSKKKATFDIVKLHQVIHQVEKCIDYAVLFKRYNKDYEKEPELLKLKQKVVNLVETGNFV